MEKFTKVLDSQHFKQALTSSRVFLNPAALKEMNISVYLTENGMSKLNIPVKEA